MQKYKLLNHTADIRMEVWGKTRKELFGNAVTAMFDIMFGGLNDDETKPMQSETIQITGTDLEDTFINFLRETLYLFNGKGWVVSSCEPLALNSRKIIAQLQGEPYNRKKIPLKTEIKAVTYHELSIKKSAEGWKARIIFDV